MMIGYEIVEVDQPAWEIIGGGLSAFNTQQAGEDNGKNLCYVVKNPEGQIVGGVIRATYWDWLYINLMWIKEDLRDQGFGKRLLGLAEKRLASAAPSMLIWTHLVFKHLISIKNLDTKSLVN
jgi:ribosomal protein S18 acetylase RimI-like enzyme